MNIDISGWSKRNMWPTAAGEIAVRPGFKYEGAAAGYDDLHAWVWTVINPFNGDVNYYMVSWNSNTLTVTIYDEDWAAFGPGGGYTLTRSGPAPAVASLAVVLDQVMVFVDGYRPLWGFLGGPLIDAVKVDSVQEVNTPAIEIPTCGLAVEWAGRCVIAKDNNIFVSDPVTAVGGSPRTFTGAGQIGRPGKIFGLHTNSRGDLIVCGADGVWSLSADVAATGADMVGSFQQVSDYRAIGFGQTCLARDRVYGLTQKGIRLIDDFDGKEWSLDEPVVSTVEYGRMASGNYRTDARAISTPRGPAVVLPDGGTGGMWRLDADTGFASWWIAQIAYAAGFVVNGFGDEVLIVSGKALRVGGNHDNYTDQGMTETAMSGGFVGPVPVPPDASPVVRRVDVAHDGSGEAMVAIRGTQKTGTPPQEGIIIGTDVWDDTTAIFESAPMSSKRLHFAQRTDDLSMEVMAANPLTRIDPTVDVDLRGPGKRRPS